MILLLMTFYKFKKTPFLDSFKYDPLDKKKLKSCVIFNNQKPIYKSAVNIYCVMKYKDSRDREVIVGYSNDNWFFSSERCCHGAFSDNSNLKAVIIECFIFNFVHREQYIFSNIFLLELQSTTWSSNTSLARPLKPKVTADRTPKIEIVKNALFTTSQEQIIEHVPRCEKGLNWLTIKTRIKSKKK